MELEWGLTCIFSTGHVPEICRVPELSQGTLSRAGGTGRIGVFSGHGHGKRRDHHVLLASCCVTLGKWLSPSGTSFLL